MDDMAERLNFSVYSNALNLPEVKEIKDGRRDFISFGEDNLFPQYIYDLFLHSALFESIIRGTSDYVMGNEVLIKDEVLEFSKKVNGDYETLKDIIEKAIFDYLLFDGFYIQIFRDSEGKIVELYNLDFQNCRIGKDEKTILYCSDWSNYRSKTVSYPRFEMDQPKKNSIFYFKGKTAPQTNTYPVPSYIGALSDIRTSTEISNFHLNSILNGFNGNLIINLNSGEVDDDTKRKVETKFKEKFCGSENSGKFILNFNENRESAITLERLQTDDFADKYNALSKTITENIFVAFRCSPQLMGLTSESTGFNSQEYNEAFKLYNKTVVKPIQLIIQRAFSKIFGMQEVISFIPFKIEEEVKNE